MLFIWSFDSWLNVLPIPLLQFSSFFLICSLELFLGVWTCPFGVAHFLPTPVFRHDRFFRVLPGVFPLTRPFAGPWPFIGDPYQKALISFPRIPFLTTLRSFVFRGHFPPPHFYRALPSRVLRVNFTYYSTSPNSAGHCLSGCDRAHVLRPAPFEPVL